jgi:hypothetical protein
MKSISCLIGFLLFISTFVSAQPGFEILKDVRKIDIPFEYENNLIIVKITFNRIFPLKFIFDTGAEHTILSKREITDILGIPYEREFKIVGSDMKTELSAYLVRNIHLKVGDMIVPNHSMLVLGDDYFRFEEMAGLEIHGILGADVFRGLAVKINYERKLITLMKYKHFTPPSGKYMPVPIEIKRNKPYLETTIQIQPDSVIRVRLLLDTGAMLSLLLNTDTHPNLKLPLNTIKGNVGTGLGGFIEGYMGRVSLLQFGTLKCTEVLTNFQELTEGVDTNILMGRNGIIGNEILSRFHLVIDYPGQMLYLQPNRRYKESFEFDKSGLVIIAANVHLNQYLIHSIIPGSPAEEAGLLPGDEIRRINFFPSGFLSLNSIQKILRRKAGKEIRVVVKRNGEKIKFNFTLRKLI